MRSRRWRDLDASETRVPRSRGSISFVSANVRVSTRGIFLNGSPSSRRHLAVMSPSSRHIATLELVPMNVPMNSLARFFLSKGRNTITRSGIRLFACIRFPFDPAAEWIYDRGRSLKASYRDRFESAECAVKLHARTQLRTQSSSPFLWRSDCAARYAPVPNDTRSRSASICPHGHDGPPEIDRALSPVGGRCGRH